MHHGAQEAQRADGRSRPSRADNKLTEEAERAGGRSGKTRDNLLQIKDLNDDH